MHGQTATRRSERPAPSLRDHGQSCRDARPCASKANRTRSGFADVDDRFRKGAWGFLRQVVPDAALDQPVLVFARELLAIGCRVRVWRAIGLALKPSTG